MTLARVWTRHLYGASGVALLAPVTIIAALAVLTAGGGLGGLSALGQLFSGPAVPVGTAPPGTPVAPRTAQAVLPVVPASTPTAPIRVAARPARGPAPPPPPARAPAHRGTGQRVGTVGRGATPPAPKPKQPPAPPTPPVAGPPQPPAPAPLPAVVDQVVALGVGVTSKLPAPLNAVGTGALQSLGQTLNTLLQPQS